MDGTIPLRGPTLSATAEVTRRITCPGCGDVRWLSARRRGIELGESTGLCSGCRFPHLRAATEEEAEAFARYWLERFTDEEIAELALGFGVEDACAENVAASRRD